MAKAGRISRYILSGIILTILPLISLVSYYQSDSQDVVLNIDTQFVETAAGKRLNIPFNNLNLSALAGDEDFKVGDVIYVHSVFEKGRVLYPFAISQNRPEKSDGVISMRGVVTQQDNNNVKIDYQFGALAQQLAKTITVPMIEDMKAEISVNSRAVVRLRALIINGTRYPAAKL